MTLHTADLVSIGLDIKLLINLFKRLREQYPLTVRLLGVRLPENSQQVDDQQLNLPF